MNSKYPKSTLALIEGMQRSALESSGVGQVKDRYMFHQNNIFSTEDISYWDYFRPPLAEKDEAHHLRYSSLEPKSNRLMFDVLHDRIFGILETILVADTGNSSESFQFERNVLFGSLPLGDANALCLAGLNDDYVVLINDGLFSTIEALSNLFVKELRDSEGMFSVPNIARALQESDYKPGLAETFSDLSGFAKSMRETVSDLITNDCFEQARNLLVNYYANNTMAGVVQNPIMSHEQPERFNLSSTVVHSALVFVICHELAHIFYGHLNRHKKSLPDKREAAEQYLWRRELLCDQFALQMMIQYDSVFNRMGVTLATSGFPLYFALSEWMRSAKIENEAREGENQIRQHPPGEIRYSSAQKALGVFLSPADYKTTMDFWGDIFSFLFIVLTISKQQDPEDFAERVGRKMQHSLNREWVLQELIRARRDGEEPIFEF